MPTVQVIGIEKSFLRTRALAGVTFDAGAGITGLLGPNGAGKSTILHMIGGFLAPSSGSVTVGGSPSWRHPEMYRRIGLVPERDAPAHPA